MKFLTSLIFCALILNQANAYCSWDLNKDLPKKDPLYIMPTKLPKLIIPTSSDLSLQTNQMMTLVCPGETNTIFGTEEQEISVECASENKVLFNGRPYPLNFFYCSSNTQADVYMTNIKCANSQGELLRLGFLSPSKGFISLITICYNRQRESVIYAKSGINGKSIANAEERSCSPEYETLGLTADVDTADMYKHIEQIGRFSEVLGESKANKYITESSYLTKGHMVPDADLDFGSWSIATYFFVNVAPQWQVINTGNWFQVENVAREIADKLQEDVTIFTGTYEILKIPKESGQMVDLYLMHYNRLQVPKWFWKIVYSPLTNKGIAFVTLNNPHVTNIHPNEMLCPNICDETHWNIHEWKDFSKGFTYCCDVNKLISAVGTIYPMSIDGYITRST